MADLWTTLPPRPGRPNDENRTPRPGDITPRTSATPRSQDRTPRSGDSTPRAAASAMPLRPANQGGPRVAASPGPAAAPGNRASPARTSGSTAGASPRGPGQGNSQASTPGTNTGAGSRAGDAPGRTATNAPSPQPSNNFQKKYIVIEDLWVEAYEALGKAEKTRNLVRKYEGILMKLYTKDLNDGSVQLNLPAGKTLSNLTGREKLPFMRDIAWKSYQQSRNSGTKAEIAANTAKFFQSVEIIFRPVVNTHTAAALAWAGIFGASIMMTKMIDANSAVKDVLLYAANQTRWYTDNVQTWLTEIERGPSLKEDDLRRQRLKEEIQIFFELILEFTMRCITHINKSFLTKAARAVIEPDVWWKQALDKLKDHRATLEEHFKLTADAKEKYDKRLAKETKIIAMFKPGGDQDMARILRLNSHRAQHTCRWFRKHPKFEKWWKGGEPQHLLVSADPGSGKTTLSAYLVEKVLPKYCPKAVVVSYFFDYSSRKDLAPALAGLIHQLLMAEPELAAHHEHLIERCGSLTNTSNLSSILNKMASHKSCPQVVCVLDALDECSKEGLGDLAALADRLPSNSKLRFVMTTRSYPEIVEKFEGLRWTHISAEEPKAKTEIQQEIEVALAAKLKTLVQKKGFSAQVESALNEAIQEKGKKQTTYLWLKLLFLTLESPKCDYRASALKNLVNGSLKGIDTLYQGFLERVDSEDQKSLSVIFNLLIAAERPLTVREIEIALRTNARWDASSLEGDENDALELVVPTGSLNFQIWLRTCCHLFVTVQGNTVGFLHLTAQEFLLQRRPQSGQESTPWYTVNSRDADRVMVESCLPYLSLPQFLASDFASKVHGCLQQAITFNNAGRVFGREFGFLLYALQYWPGHFLRFQGERDDTSKPMSQQLVKCYIDLFGRRNERGYVETPNWLTLCSWLQGWHTGSEGFGFHGKNALGILMDGDSIKREWETYGGAAARWDHYQMLKYFVPRSATTTTTTGNPPRARAPRLSAEARADLGKLLHLAVQGSALGSLAYLMALPTVKEFINEQDSRDKTPLARAAGNFGDRTALTRHVEVATILLEHGADKFIDDCQGLLPFCHLVQGIDKNWPHFIDFEYSRQKGTYTTLARRLMLNKKTTQWQELPAATRDSYDESLEFFLKLARKGNGGT